MVQVHPDRPPMDLLCLYYIVSIFNEDEWFWFLHTVRASFPTFLRTVQDQPTHFIKSNPLWLSKEQVYKIITIMTKLC